MNKILFLLAFLAIVTIFIAIFNPELHKPLVISEGRYSMQTEDIAKPKNDYKTVVTNQETVTGENPVKITQKEAEPEIKQVVAKAQNTTSVVKTNVQNKSNTKPVQTKVNKTTSKPVTRDVNTKTVKNTSQKPVNTAVTQPKPVQKKEIKHETPKPAAVQSTPAPQVKPSQEEISWNVWRSKLANQIISEIRMPQVPEGTIFEFSFNVNNQGVISNVRTKSSAPQYTAYAIQYIAPVIRSFNGRSILRFPSGTERTSILFESKWRVVNGNVQYSTPSNYHDIEVIRK